MVFSETVCTRPCGSVQKDAVHRYLFLWKSDPLPLFVLLHTIVHPVFSLTKTPKRVQHHRLLALTGARLKGREVSALGLSTHFCKSSLLPALCNQLASCKPAEVGELLDEFMRESGGRGGEEENRLDIAWAEAEKAGHLTGTFAR